MGIWLTFMAFAVGKWAPGVVVARSVTFDVF